MFSVQAFSCIFVVQTAKKLIMKNLVLLLLLLSSLSIFAQNIDDCAQKSEKTQQNTSDVRYKASASEVNMGYSVTNADEVMVYDIVERMPTFPGGQAAMFKFIQHNMS